MRIRNAERRLRAFVGVCQSKRTCEHTGGPQPTYRLEHGTLRIMAEFPQQKEEDEDVLGAGGAMERKQARGWRGCCCLLLPAAGPGAGAAAAAAAEVLPRCCRGAAGVGER